MAKKDYTAFSEQIIPLLGGSDNITSATHCITRLRFHLKNKGLADIEKLKTISEILKVQWSSEELQLVIGSAVGDAYSAVCKSLGIAESAAVADEQEPSSAAHSPRTAKEVFSRVIDGISSSIFPAINIFVGVGLVKVIVLLCELAGIMTPDMPTDQVLTFVADAGMYFLPVFVGGFAMRKFGGDLGLGLLLGAMLVAPSFVSGVAAGNVYSFFGLPIYSATYTYSVFPSILIGFCGAQVEKFVGKHAPRSIRTVLEPLVTLLVMIPLSFCLLAPLGNILGIGLNIIVLWMSDHLGFVALSFMAGFMSLIVMTGMHSAMGAVAVNMVSTVGYDTLLLPAIVISNINQGVAALAVACKTKNTDLRATGLACGVTACVAGVTEPALFGINLKYRKPQIAAMLGGFIGGAFGGLMKLKAFAFVSSQGIFGITMFIGEPSSNLLFGIASVVIGAVSTFILTMILYKDAPTN